MWVISRHAEPHRYLGAGRAKGSTPGAILIGLPWMDKHMFYTMIIESYWFEKILFLKSFGPSWGKLGSRVHSLRILPCALILFWENFPSVCLFWPVRLLGSVEYLSIFGCTYLLAEVIMDRQTFLGMYHFRLLPSIFAT